MLTIMMTINRDPASAAAETVVTVAEAKRDLPRLLRRVEAGERITITRYGRPVATLRAAAQRAPSLAALRARAGAGGALQLLLDERERERSAPASEGGVAPSTSTPAS